jgi:rhodanese-related sulfurtransferase
VTFVTANPMACDASLRKINIMTIEEKIKAGECSIVDVRTPAEFQGGHVAGSINIPLQEIPDHVEALNAMKRPLILCCLSGGRSGQATQFLSAQGFQEVYNGGSWLDVNFIISKNQ